MELGEKIRRARIEKHMTQSEVASDKITRNMLSAIESGKAQPSLDTLLYIAKKLDLPMHYLLSDEMNEYDFRKYEIMPSVRSAFKNHEYAVCIYHAKKNDSIDDELAYILAYSHFELGVVAAKNGAFLSAEEHFLEAYKYSGMTIYDTSNIEFRIPLYRSFGKNVNAPLLDFDKDAYFDAMSKTTDLEFYRYICNDWEYSYKNPLFKLHAAAKIKIKERKYSEAINILLEIAETKSDFEYNAYLMYVVYGDLDNCYKQILDFENAYKYVCKRMSMLEGFNS